jgi:ATP-dependent Clp protease ATP-binding subunit ClpA
VTGGRGARGVAGTAAAGAYPETDIAGYPEPGPAPLRPGSAGDRERLLTERSGEMFERFTDRARRVVVLAQDEARMLNHDYIGTEHILLGLIHEGDGVAAKALEAMGIGLAAVRVQVEEIIGQGEQAPSGHIPFTPRAKKVLELSLREALQLNHDYIGTEHILLGLIREGDGVAAQVLVRLGADLNRVRQQVIQLLHDYHSEVAETPRAAARRGGPAGRRDRDLSELSGRIRSLESRLAAIERRVGVGPDTGDLDAEIAQARREKEAAVEVQDFEKAAALRDNEKQLLARKAARGEEWSAQHPDLPSVAEALRELTGAVERLRGPDTPQDGAA